MKRTIIIVAAILFVGVATFLIVGHLRQNRILGSWNASQGASVQFSRDGAFTYHASSVEIARNPAAPHFIRGSYKILDNSHLQLAMAGFPTLVTTYSLSGDTLNLTIADESKSYKRVSH